MTELREINAVGQLTFLYQHSQTWNFILGSNSYSCPTKMQITFFYLSLTLTQLCFGDRH